MKKTAEQILGGQAAVIGKFDYSDKIWSGITYTRKGGKAGAILSRAQGYIGDLVVETRTVNLDTEIEVL